MVLRLLRITMVAAALLVAWDLAPHDSHQAQAAGRERVAPDLFYNFYVPPGAFGGAGAELYISPRPTPPLVGHTYITYQPLMPHEFLYKHGRTYVYHRPDGKRTKTKVSWR